MEERRDQHYLRRPGNLAVRRSRARRGLLRRLVSLAAQAAVIAGLWLLARQIYLFGITSSWFEVRTIAIRGNHHAKTTDLIALAGPVVSRNIFQVDLESLRASLARSPWILDAAVRRSLPDTIEVLVHEREPAAIAAFEGRPWLVDATGRLLGEYGPELASYDFPVLTGLEGLPRPEAIRRLHTGAAAAARLEERRPAFAKLVSELDLSAPDRIAVRPADGSPVLYLHVVDCLRNLENYEAIRSLIPHKLPGADQGAPAKVAWVDLRFRGRIAVMPEPLDGTGTDRVHR